MYDPNIKRICKHGIIYLVFITFTANFAVCITTNQPFTLSRTKRSTFCHKQSIVPTSSHCRRTNHAVHIMPSFSTIHVGKFTRSPVLHFTYAAACSTKDNLLHLQFCSEPRRTQNKGSCTSLNQHIVFKNPKKSN